VAYPLPFFAKGYLPGQVYPPCWAGAFLRILCIWFCTGLSLRNQFRLAPLLLTDKICEMQSAVQAIFNVDELRAQLRKMDDVKLCEFGKAARHMTAPRANLDQAPLQDYVIQLQEATAEWRRRHPKNWQSESVKEQH